MEFWEVLWLLLPLWKQLFYQCCGFCYLWRR